ncbi:MAG: hypothetical protein OEY94_03850 [Alphaproteobacteria bacterium]|nr:hypothetical protein [Alphaproteobacteria bacterium]
MDNPTQPENDDSLDNLDLMDDSAEDEVWAGDDEDWLDEEDENFSDDNTNIEDENLEPSPKKRKSSGGSKMILILLIVGGAGGGAYFYTLSSEQSTDVSYPPVVQNVMPEDTQNALDKTTNPDTESITAQPDNNIAQEIPAFDANPADPIADIPAINNDPGVLTPMPDAAAIENTTLAQLEPTIPTEEPFSDTVSPFDDIPSVSENDTPTPDVPSIELGSETLNETVAVQDSPSEGLISLEEDVMLEKTEIEHSALPTDLKEENTKTVKETNITPAIDTPVKQDEQAPIVPAPTVEAPTQIDSDTTQKVSEEKIIEVPPEPAAMKEPVKETVKPQQTVVSSEKVTKSEPENTQKPVSKYKATDWALRSAQNGSAVLYNKKSGETKSVETGYFVPGIGRITSISKINGKWVVKGSIGSVSQ